MAKTASSNIYQLIYSLSPSEKRYFKLFTNNQVGKQNKSCLQMFEIIAKNEGKPIEKVEKKFTFTEQPSRLKNYLYELILKSLEVYHSKSSVNIELRKLLNQVEILYSKALYRQCISLIKKGIKLADEYENLILKVELYTWYMSSINGLDSKGMDEQFNRILMEKENIIEELKTTNEYNKLRKKINHFINKTGTMKSQEGKMKIKEYMNHNLLQNPGLAKTFSAKTSYHNTFNKYYNYIGDKEKQHYHQLQVLKLYDTYPSQVKLNQFNYITTLVNAALSCFTNGDEESAFHYLEKLIEVKAVSKQIEIKKFEYHSANLLHCLNKCGEVEKALAHSLEVEEKLLEYGDKVTDLFRIVIYTNLSVSFIHAGEYKKALKYNNLVQESKNSNYRKDIFRFAQYINLIIHYERGERVSMEYFIRSAEHKIKDLKNYAFEKVFLRYLKQIINLSGTDLETTLVQFEKELLEIFSDHKERVILEHFNLLAWLFVKNENIPFSKALKTFNKFSFEDYYKARENSFNNYVSKG